MDDDIAQFCLSKVCYQLSYWGGEKRKDKGLLLCHMRLNSIELCLLYQSTWALKSTQGIDVILFLKCLLFHFHSFRVIMIPKHDFKKYAKCIIEILGEINVNIFHPLIQLFVQDFMSYLSPLISSMAPR